MPSQYSSFVLVTLYGALTLTGVIGQSCDSPLGFEDGSISDDQLTASSSSTPSYTASQARLNVGDGWVSTAGTEHQYLLVDLLAQFNVTRYAVQGSSEAGSVNNFTLYYSNDRLTWTTYIADTGSVVLPGTVDSESVSTHEFLPAVKARFLAIQPLISGENLRIELYGCELEWQERVNYTLVGSEINDNQNWMIEGSPYIINSEIVINETSRVRIQEGVKVVFNSSRAGITVFGTLEAKGTEFRQPLPFAHTPNQWMGLALENQGTILLDNCTVSGARTGLMGSFGSMDVRNSRVFENNVGIHLKEGAVDESIVLSGTTIDENVEEGIMLNDVDFARSLVVLENCRVSNNGNGFGFEAAVTLIAKETVFSFNQGHGISNVNDSDFSISIVLDNCFFEENSRGLELAYDRSSSTSSLNLTVSKSTFKRNKEFGLSLSIRNSPKFYRTLITDSYILENSASGLRINLPEVGNGHPLINVINNTFLDIEDRYPFYRYHISVNSRTKSSVRANVTLEQNIFQKGISMELKGNNNITYNISNNTITTTETWTDAGLIIKGGEVHLEGNTFINCTTRVVIKTASPLGLNRNVFINPGAEFDLFVELDHSQLYSEIINASFNYWGTEKPRSRIRDFFNNSDVIVVRLDPVFTSPEMDEVKSDSVAFSQNGSNAGGWLYQNEVIGPHQYLVVKKSIYVPEGVQLTILEGVSLWFVIGTGIHVEGSLAVSGEKSNTVVMGPYSRVETEEESIMFEMGPDPVVERWNGLRIHGTGSSFTHAGLHSFRSIEMKGENPSITFAHTFINDCSQAFSIQKSKDFKLTLNDVEIIDCDSWMDVYVFENSTVTVEINNSLINTQVGMGLYPSSSGHLNVSVHNTNLNVPYQTFSLQSYSTALSLRVEHSSFTQRSRYGSLMDIITPALNLKLRGLDIKAPISVTLCPISTNTMPGVLEVRDSRFDVEDDASPLNVNGYGKGSFNPHDVVVVNNTFTGYSGSPSVSINTTHHNTTTTVGIVVSDNIFHQLNLTINSDAEFVYLKRNIFRRKSSIIAGGQECIFEIHSIGNSSIVFMGNQLTAYRQLIVSTDGLADIDVIDNIVKYAFVNLSASNVNMTKNTFEDSTIELDTMIGGASDRESVSGAGDCTVTENLFKKSRLIITNPYSIIQRNQFYDIRQYVNLEFKGHCFADMTVNCSHNFWDTRHDYAISSRIYDSTENKDLPVIIFKPFYLYSNFTELQEDSESSSGPFLSPNGTVGGSIGGHVTLSANGSPYIVTEDIRVERLESLTLEAGVTLLFPRFTSLTVFGKLRILGNSSHPVYAKAKVDGEKWFGMRLSETKHRATLTPEVRLVGGCPGKEGRVEVKRGGVWRPVCGQDFGQQDAKVVCSGLGYDPDERHEVLTHSTGTVLNGIIDVVFNCDGTEDNLLECSTSPRDCSNKTIAYVRCREKKLPRREDIGYEVEIHHFIINDTEVGLAVEGGVSSFDFVESSFSLSTGITFQTRTLPSKISGITATNNKNSGIYFPAYGGVDLVEFSSCAISNNNVGVRINKRIDISFESCRFEENDKTIYLRTGAVISIRNSTFEMNNVVFESTAANSNGELKFSLINSFVSRSKGDEGIMLFRPKFTNACTFEISNNVFSLNSGKIIYFSLNGAKNDSSVHIRNNSLVQNNASLVEIASRFEKRLLLEISNNVISENTYPQSLVKLDYDTRQAESSVSISGNTLSNNEAPSIIEIDNSRTYFSRIDMVKNRFIQNNCSTTIKVSPYEVQMTSNVFMNPEAQCELEYPVFRRNVDIDARLNYWGGSTHDYVSGRICSFDGDMSRGFVFYIPYYDSEELGMLKGNTREHFWTDNRKGSGGLVENKLVLGKDTSPYTINRSIYIRNGGVLHVPSGVELRFKRGTGIYVDGTLVAQAEGPEKIVFQRADDSPWFGVVFPLMLDSNKGTVRLVDHNERKEGRVEMCINGTWTRVCQVLYPDEKLICRAMGYESGRAEIGKGSDDNRKGSVVEDLGCKSSMWSLYQCQPTVASNTSICGDVRVRCHQNIAVTSDHQESYLEGVSILDSKVGLVISTQTVRLSNCYINNTMQAGVTLEEDFIDVDLNGTLIEHGQSDGIFVKVEKYFNIRNGIIRYNRGNGMTVRTFLTKGYIEGILFMDNRVGLEVAGFTSGNRFLVINNNVFRGMDIGLVMDMGVHDSEGWINIINNHFDDIKRSMDVRLFGLAYVPFLRELHVRSNNFTSSGEISFLFESPFSLFFEDNVAHAGVTDECFVSMELPEFENLSVSANQFENISAKCVVKVKTFSTNKVKFDYNSIRQSKTSDAVALLELTDSSFSYNIFENPASPFDLRVLSPWEVTLNASNNWWDGQNEVEASSRLVDKLNSTLSVSLSPVLTNLDFTCSGDIGCANKGRCVAPGTCWCKLGFTGVDCSEFDCSGVWNCSSHGSCVGPNLCQCLSGWEGTFCSIATQDDVGLCSFTSTTSSTPPISTTTQLSIVETTQPDVSGAVRAATSILHTILSLGIVFVLSAL